VLIRRRHCVAQVHGAVCEKDGWKRFLDVTVNGLWTGWSGFKDTFDEHHAHQARPSSPDFLHISLRCRVVLDVDTHFCSVTLCGRKPLEERHVQPVQGFSMHFPDAHLILFRDVPLSVCLLLLRVAPCEALWTPCRSRRMCG